MLECGGDTRALHRLVDNLTGKEKSPILPKRSTPQDVAADFSKLIADDTFRLDLMPTSLLKNFVRVLADPIARIVNASIATGHLPGQIKHDVITLLLKKPSSKLSLFSVCLSSPN